jgi:hypothetical protein
MESGLSTVMMRSHSSYICLVNFVGFRLTDIAYCITLGHKGDVSP